MSQQVARIPAYLLESVAAHARTQHPREACGFLVGRRGRGPERFVPIPNVHPEPERFFRMDTSATLNAFMVMDELGEDPLAVYHSHTRTGSAPSTTDIEVIHDLDAIHLICSTAKSVAQPTFQAWTIRESDNGRFPEEVALDIIDADHPDSPVQGLVEGNHVRLTYNSAQGARRTVVGVVGPHERESVIVYPMRVLDGAERRLLVALDRIVSVSILVEGAGAARTRATAASFLAEAAMRVASKDTEGARAALERAAALMPRLMPRAVPVPRGWRPLRASEKRALDAVDGSEDKDEQDRLAGE